MQADIYHQAEIEKQIPKIVGLLGTSDNSRDLVKTAFASVLQKISPADLMVVLHGESVGRKAAIEGKLFYNEHPLQIGSTVSPGSTDSNFLCPLHRRTASPTLA